VLINADFSRPAISSYVEGAFEPSPMEGVGRLMLDRIGGEKARATSIVRYAAKSRFSEHCHDAGEEFLVLSGVFSDSSGDFGPGVYVRNPPGTAHAPWSESGCTIFVKLRQFDRHDLRRVVVDTRNAGWKEAGGVRRLALHEYGSERVELLDLSAGARIEPEAAEVGIEYLVIDGRVTVGGRELGRWSWVRLPPGSETELHAAELTRLYRKRGHLGSNAIGI
jgi:anti-sigma factor ChrR (cupin superfamily)